MVKIIPDVSEHQSKIDWSKLKGIPGAIIRIGYGDNLRDQDDVYASYNLKECERLGIPFAAYLYSYADSSAHIKSEIEHMERMCAGYKPVAHILDLEEWRYKDFAATAAKEWIKAFPDTGIIYAGQAYWKSPLKDLDCLRWIPAYGYNSGKPEANFKPAYKMVGWQYTSRATLAGVTGYVDLSEWYGTQFDGVAVEAIAKRRPVYKKEVAALIMQHLCTHDAHGYTQDMDKRWGTGEEEIDIYGHTYKIKGGDRDCSTAVINAYEAAGISCGGATYTGNMQSRMTGTGNFRWRGMSYIAQMGDSYLNEKNHTAMCLSAEPDVLMEFSINEKGAATGGKQGDQLQQGEYDAAYGRGESHLKLYYDYPWDGILQCINDEIAFYIRAEPEGGTEPAEEKEDKTADTAARVILGDYGTGKERQRKLGSDWTEVQAVVTNVVKNHREELIARMADFIASL